MQKKAIKIELKDFDQKQGIVQFYAAAFGNRDSDNDIIRPGSYKKTVEENRNRIKHFKNHDATQVPGVVKELLEDNTGLLVTSQLAMTTLGRDTLIEYEAGIITEHSQGFQILQEEFDSAEGVNIIKEIKLWEVSSLTAWGANQNTPTVDVKDAEHCITLMKKINYILTKTGITDNRAEEFEAQYKQLSELYKALIKSEESTEVTPEVDESHQVLEALKAFNKKLKN